MPQPGIGTYTDPSLTLKGKLYVAVAKLLDLAFAWYINGQYVLHRPSTPPDRDCGFGTAHVLGGYRFLMQNYKPGDRICVSSARQTTVHPNCKWHLTRASVDDWILTWKLYRPSISGYAPYSWAAVQR